MSKKSYIYDDYYLDTSGIVHNRQDLSTVLDETNSDISSLTTLLGVGGVDSYSLGTSGYIRFKGGLQIAWNRVSVTAGGTLWNTTYPVYYSDHSMGSWTTSFNTLYACFVGCNNTSYWTGFTGTSASSAGTIRCFRPNSSTAEVVIYIIGIGKWS